MYYDESCYYSNIASNSVVKRSDRMTIPIHQETAQIGNVAIIMVLFLFNELLEKTEIHDDINAIIMTHYS